jgi:hypothetical protein
LLIGVSALAELADTLNRTEVPLTAGWADVDDQFRSWAARTDLRIRLRTHVSSLPAAEAAALIARSRETTTHFAWCLRDRPGEQFTFWLHEYKPQRDWRAGYADSVHNHRYHFCTVIVRGGYRHERYDADLNPLSGLITAVRESNTTHCGEGDTQRLLASDFHRIPWAADDTITFLVKSRPVTISSVSFDPETRVSHLHLPIESRLSDLPQRI